VDAFARWLTALVTTQRERPLGEGLG